MSIDVIALMLAASLIGPLLASWNRWRVPVAVGELLIGVLLGVSGLDVVPTSDPGLEVLANVGFALTMLVAGSHVNVSALADGQVAGRAFAIVATVSLVAVPLAFGIEALTGVGEPWLFAVLLLSSSAAIVLPIVNQFAPEVDTRLLIAQVTIADVIAVVALPLVLRSPNFWAALAGAGLVALLAFAFYSLLRLADVKGWLERFRTHSKQHRLGLELRVSLIVVLALAALSSRFNLTVMLAGFATGLAISAVGVPHRLARQLFAISEGFFAPLFFIWLGATLDVRQVVSSPANLALFAALSAGTLLLHLVPRVFGQSWPQALMSSAQLGVPAAAVAIGTAAGALNGGQGAAILAAALVSIVATTLAARRVTG